MESTELFSKLALLEGNWEGKGYGEFPTIPSFNYDETIQFSIDHSRKIMLYTQKTFLKEEQRNSHWETGFIFPDGKVPGKIKINNIQSGGRIEIMEGRFEADKLVLDTLQFYNDIRILAAKRIWQWTDTVFTYKMYMHTSSSETQCIHLTASLTRTKK